jgi:hypothetical protein
MEIVSGDPILTIRDSSTALTNSSSILRLAESASGDTLGLYWDIALDGSGGTVDFTVGNNTTEAMRIDSSGNLLVGTTTSGGNNGHTLNSYGLAQHKRASGHALILDRLTDDGAIATFRKDGTDVGSIGTRSGVVSQIVLDPRSGSFQGSGIAGSGEAITPMDHSQQADAHTSLGNSSYRWKDLYLSGGVYLGGTGSANLLDDYEEGTWTVGFADSSGNNSTTTSSFSYYTKIGNTVHAFALGVNQIDTSGLTSGDDLQITGLPFTSIGSAQSGGSIALDQFNFGNNSFVTPIILGGTTSVKLQVTNNSANGSRLTVSAVTSGVSDLDRMYICYQTT